jgi:hypothetical protein
MSAPQQDITKKHLYISDPKHPHYPEQGYLTGEVISLFGSKMAKFRLDHCRHGVDACFVSHGQLARVISRPVSRRTARAAKE